MIFVPVLAVLFAPVQEPPADTAWGNPVDGVRLGLSVRARPDGPPVLDCYLKNNSDVVAVYAPEDKHHAPATPEYMLKGKAGIWFVSPPSSYPGIWNGPDYRQVTVPAHMTVLANSSRFFFGVTAGKYTVSASYSTLRRNVKSNTVSPVQFDSEATTIELGPGHVQPAMAAGIG